MQVAWGIGALGSAGEETIGLGSGQRKRGLWVIRRARHPALERVGLLTDAREGYLDAFRARDIGAASIALAELDWGGGRKRRGSLWQDLVER